MSKNMFLTISRGRGKTLGSEALSKILYADEAKYNHGAECDYKSDGKWIWSTDNYGDRVCICSVCKEELPSVMTGGGNC